MTIHDTIAQIEALEAKATPRPWHKPRHNAVTSNEGGTGVQICNFHGTSENNAALIVALRNAAPSLIAYIRALEKQIADLTSDAAVDAAGKAYYEAKRATQANESWDTTGFTEYSPDWMKLALAAAREAGK